MHALTRRLLAPAAVLLTVFVATPAHADPVVTQDSGMGAGGGSSVAVGAESEGTSGGSGSSSSGSGCHRGSEIVPCTSDLGTWSNVRQCYVRLADPPPDQSTPVWGGHTDGAIYICTPESWDLAYVFWSPTAPVSPEQLAQQALSTIRLPSPVIRRSPTEANSYNGTPYTWVGLWTWFWTDPDTWQTLSARASAGSVWAEATVTPRVLVITPGNGDAAVRCAGPGRAWTEADGNDAPSNGCGYVYRHVTDGTLTATVTIEWAVTWTGSGGSGGTLPVMRTSATSTFSVMQIQIVTR
jgi:hypothetical protein